MAARRVGNFAHDGKAQSASIRDSAWNTIEAFENVFIFAGRNAGSVVLDPYVDFAPILIDHKRYCAAFGRIGKGVVHQIDDHFSQHGAVARNDGFGCFELEPEIDLAVERLAREAFQNLLSRFRQINPVSARTPAAWFGTRKRQQLSSKPLQLHGGILDTCQNVFAVTFAGCPFCETGLR